MCPCWGSIMPKPDMSYREFLEYAENCECEACPRVHYRSYYLDLWGHYHGYYVFFDNGWVYNTKVGRWEDRITANNLKKWYHHKNKWS